MDGPNQGHKLIQVHKVDGPTKGQDPSPRSGRTPLGSQTYTSPQSGRTPPGSQTYTSLQSGRTPPGFQTYTSPQNGRTPPRVKTIVHKVDGLGKGKKHKYPQSG